MVKFVIYTYTLVNKISIYKNNWAVFIMSYIYKDGPTPIVNLGLILNFISAYAWGRTHTMQALKRSLNNLGSAVGKDAGRCSDRRYCRISQSLNDVGSTPGKST